MITNRPDGNTYYNYTDLNRVESAAYDMAELLISKGYYVTISTKTNWTRTDFPTETQMGRYLNNIKQIRRQFPALWSYELPETMRALNYVGANNIEKLLKDIPSLVTAMTGAYRRCNTFNCGT